jgi:transketolase
MDRSQIIAQLESLTSLLRIDIVEMLTEAGSGHPGGSLSAIDLIATLYQCVLRHRPEEPDWPERDRFVLSKGHGVPALYATLAYFGYFPRQELRTLRKLDSRLQGHPARFLCPGVEVSAGSLGQGLSAAQGMAIAARLDGRQSRIYCMIGDGESQEGQIWEAAMSAPKFGLDNLCLILDHNQGQIDGPTAEVMDIEPVVDKLRAFRWQTTEIDGHDFGAILDALAAAAAVRGRPQAIVAHTVKGKGVSFMEDPTRYHGVAPTAEEGARAVAEIRARAAAAGIGLPDSAASTVPPASAAGIARPDSAGSGGLAHGGGVR